MTGRNVLVLVNGSLRELPAGDTINGADTTVFEQMGLVTGRAQLLGNYTLGVADRGWMLESAASSDVLITIPAQSGVAFPINSLIHFHRFGAGELAFTPDSGVTLYSASGFRKLAAQYTTASLWKRAADEWVLSGVLKA